MRVLTVSERFLPYLGGAENVARLIVEHTNDGEFVNDVLTEASDDVAQAAGGHVSLPLVDRQYGYLVRRFKRFRLRGREKNGPLFKYYTFAQYVRHILMHSRDYDVIHAHTYHWPAFASVLAARLSRTPVVVTGHNRLSRLMEQVEKKQYPAFWVNTLRRADSFVAISREIEREAPVLLNVPEERVCWIPNGIDTARFVPVASDEERRRLRETLGIAPDSVAIVYHGRLESHKNIEALIRALAVLRDANVKCNALIIGAGTAEKALYEHIQRLGLDGAVRIIGFQQNVDAYLRASDIYCLPSFVEGLSLALLEAMASGLACVASDIPGTADVVQDGENGLLFDLEDEAALVAHLRSLCSDVAMRQKLGAAGRRTVVEDYSVALMVERYRALYTQVAAAS